MPKRSLPRIAAVAADQTPLNLRVRWEEGGESRVDVSGPIGAFRVYEPLRRSPELFGRVRVGVDGTDVVWSDEIDMHARDAGLEDRIEILGGVNANVAAEARVFAPAS